MTVRSQYEPRLVCHNIMGDCYIRIDIYNYGYNIIGRLCYIYMYLPIYRHNSNVTAFVINMQGLKEVFFGPPLVHN